MSIETHGTIIVFRPLYELKNHIKHFTIPDIFLLIRVVKACVRAYFGGPFYETDSVCVRASDGFVHDIKGKIQTGVLREDINRLRPFSLESALLFVPTTDLFTDRDFKALKTKGPLSLTNVVTFFRDTLNDTFFNQGMTLWNHLAFALTPYEK